MVVNYESILRKKVIRIYQLEETLISLDNHLKTHENDYQAVIKYYVLKSNIEERKREVKLLDYKAKVQKYR